MSASSRSRRRAAAAAATLGVVLAALPTAASAGYLPAVAGPAGLTVTGTADAGLTELAEDSAFEDGAYVVVMDDAPVAAYTGGVTGYAATRPAAGEKFDPTTADANRYRGLLKKEQERVIAAIGVEARQRFTDTVSGFAATLTATQAEALAKQPGVLGVAPDELMQPDTAVSPDVLGLSGEDGVWERLGGVENLRNGAGSGVVVGIIDSGIRPEHPSFADLGLRAAPSSGWRGVCDAGEEDDFACSDKLVGARFYAETFAANNELAEYESLSPLDVDGHGTHTASTAAGNAGVEAVIDDISYGEISGMAPAARVAAYKVCWDSTTGGGCYGSDSVAAIEDAVADGVDVLNFSISGTLTNVLDPVELAFLGAAEAGVFVAASAGNSGPGVSTVAHPSPWVTTVAASTHNVMEATLVTGDGQRYIGASVQGEIATDTAMVLSEDIPADGASVEDAGLCVPSSLDPAGAAGKIVVCDRGVIARVDKSAAVEQAGGVGMVQLNVTESSLDADIHAVPSVHLSHTYRDAVRAYVRTAENPVGRILDTNEGTTTEVPEVAGFSSRGPSLAAGGDLLKPDVSAPGVSVLAGYSPELGGMDFNFVSGTSMSSPHVAGLAALVIQEHPRWSPMAVKSAMMTTADAHASAASSDPFASGAGFVDPTEFLDPGLVYETDSQDWWDFLAGQGVVWGDGTPVSDNPVDASDLNLPSIAIGQLVGSQTVTRTITNVTGRTATFTAATTGLDGLEVTVSPETLTLKKGASAEVAITVAGTDATRMGAYAKGELVWTGSDGSSVGSPVVVRPVPASAPAIVTAPAGASDVDIEILPGFSGTIGTDVDGLAAGEVTAATAPDTAGADGAAAIVAGNVHSQDFTIGTDRPLVRVELRSTNPDGDDLDLFLTRKGQTQILASAATGAADEVLTIDNFPSGEWTIHVQAWAVEDGTPEAEFDVRFFEVPDADTGNLTLDPSELVVSRGQPATVTALLPGDETVPYFGRVNFTSGGATVASTLVSVG